MFLTAHADDDGFGGRNHEIRHVLLISVDGLHALDLSNYVATHPNSTLAALSQHGVTFTNNSTSTPSDSFPGLASLVTGGSPTTTGLWYDDTYTGPCPRRLRPTAWATPAAPAPARSAPMWPGTKPSTWT